MSLLETCQADVKDSLMLDVEIKAFAAETATVRERVIVRPKKATDICAWNKSAKQFGTEILYNLNVDDGRKVDLKSSFKPANKRKPSKNPAAKNKKRKQSVSTTSEAKKFGNPSKEVPINSFSSGIRETPCFSTSGGVAINSSFGATIMQPLPDIQHRFNILLLLAILSTT